MNIADILAVRRIAKAGGGLPTGGASYQQLVTDGQGVAKWENKLAYNTAPAQCKLYAPGLNVDDMNVIATFFKISSEPSLIYNANVVKMWINNSDEPIVVPVETFMPIENKAVASGAHIIAVLEDNVDITMLDMGELRFVAPDKGVYVAPEVIGFALQEDAESPEYTFNVNAEGLIKKLDSSFIPGVEYVKFEAPNADKLVQYDRQNIYSIEYGGIDIFNCNIPDTIKDGTRVLVTANAHGTYTFSTTSYTGTGDHKIIGVCSKSDRGNYYYVYFAKDPVLIVNDDTNNPKYCSLSILKIYPESQLVTINLHNGGGMPSNYSGKMSIYIDASLIVEEEAITKLNMISSSEDEGINRFGVSIDGNGTLKVTNETTGESVPVGGGGASEKVLYEAQGLEFTASESGYVTQITPAPFVVEPNKTYTVEWDGVIYECASFMIETGLFAIGNMALVGDFEGTGEPFIMAAENTEMFLIQAISDEPTHDVKISIVEEKSSGGMMRVNITVNDDDTYSADKTYAEISEAIASGIVPYCVLGTDVYMLSFSNAISEMATYSASNKHKFTHFSYWYPTLHEITINEGDDAFYRYVTLQQATES